MVAEQCEKFPRLLCTDTVDLGSQGLTAVSITAPMASYSYVRYNTDGTICLG